jgi:glycosyltransferase involved in cell wall biosynthesis
MRVAMIGQKGIPATYGGVERAVEELSAKLVERGHEVTVFNRRASRDEPIREHRGIRLVPVAATQGKYTGNLTQSLAGVLRTVPERYDVVHFHAMGPSLWSPVARYVGRTKVVATVQGRDDQRAKWGGLAQLMLRSAAWTSANVPDEVIVVSRQLQREFADEYGRSTHHIPNGATPVDWDRAVDTSVLDRFDLEGRTYLLNVGRLVPEKAIDQAILAFRRIDTDARLVIVGGSSHTSEYVAHLHRLAAADDRVILTGPIYGDELHALFVHADAYVMPSLLEGLPLALLEAANYRLPLVVSDIEPHVEVVTADEPGHRVFRTGDVDALRCAIDQTLIDLPFTEAACKDLEERVAEEFSWDRITSLTEDVYEQALGGGRRGR